MITIHVCVGSACHLKGAYTIVSSFEKLIKENRLEDKVILKGAFCLGHCTTGVSVRLNEEEVQSVDEKNIEDFFNTQVVRRINKSEISTTN